MSARETADQIAEDAARWVIRIDREGRTPEIQSELDAWMGQDARRSGALLMAEASWAALDRLTPSRPQSAVVRRVSQPIPAQKLTRRAIWAAAGGLIAASVTATVGLSVLAPRGEVYRTAVGEVRRVPLADRSTMAVNTASLVKVRYAETRRTVVLEAGEAWFQVAKDKARPFMVTAGRVQVEAVGTAFSVRLRPNGADVMVTEGVVRVWVTGSEADAVFVTAGSAVYAADTAVIRREPELPAPAIERKLAWRSGRLDLQGETLQDAVEEFNRYNAIVIVVADPTLAQQRLYGVFRLDDASGFAQTAAVTLDASLEVQNDRIILDVR